MRPSLYSPLDSLLLDKDVGEYKAEDILYSKFNCLGIEYLDIKAGYIVLESIWESSDRPNATLDTLY